MTMNVKHYTYRVSWSPEDQEHIGLCAEFPSLSWLASDPAQALAGIMQVAAQAARLFGQPPRLPQPEAHLRAIASGV
jgi:hypothetical protein